MNFGRLAFRSPRTRFGRLQKPLFSRTPFAAPFGPISTLQAADAKGFAGVDTETPDAAVDEFRVDLTLPHAVLINPDREPGRISNLAAAGSPALS